ncbi:MAG: FKBP-type peptidyl-prolyl cis-trans isomerase [Pseudomonadota bacterium]
MTTRLLVTLLATLTVLACKPRTAPAEDTPAAQPIEHKKLPVLAPKPGDLPAPPDVAAAPADAQVTPSGLAYKVLSPGDGQTRPTAEDTVVVNYSGWTRDGRMFDSSVKRGQPARFPLNRVIKGWTEGVQLMSKGEKTRFWIPAELAYGDKPMRPNAPSGMLVFDIELLEVAR